MAPDGPVFGSRVTGVKAMIRNKRSKKSLSRVISGRSGTTLLELLVVMGVVGFMAIAAARIFIVSIDINDSERSEAKLIRRGRLIMNRLNAELRTAVVVIQADAGYLRFVTLGKTTPAIPDVVTYQLQADTMLWWVNAAEPQTIAEDVTAFVPGGVRFWSQLGSSTDILNPVLGAAGTFGTPPNFEGVKFGNGLNCSEASYVQVTFPTLNCLSHSEGTVEFWMKPNFSATATSGMAVQTHLFDSNSGVSGERLELFFDKDLELLIFRMNGSSGTEISSRPSWSSGDIVHVAIVWDSMGRHIGNGETMALYINGTKQIDSGAVTTTWQAGAFGSFFCFGGAAVSEARASFDNLKIYDYARTDFDSRYEEADMGIVTVYLNIDDGDKSIDVTGAVRMF